MEEHQQVRDAPGGVGAASAGGRSFGEGDAHHPAPRVWVLLCGAWMALCWLAIPIAILTGAFALIVLAIVGSAPVAWYWRIKYMRGGQMRLADILVPSKVFMSYLHPMRDAVAEWRASQGAGPGARI